MILKKYRDIVESTTEPEDKFVLWYKEGRLYHYKEGLWRVLLTIESNDIIYTTEEDSNIGTMKDALDKLLYVTPQITSFIMDKDTTYEVGTNLSDITLRWQYNKDIKEQRLNDSIIPSDVRATLLKDTITKDTTYRLWATDGINNAFSTINVKFIDFIYYGALRKKDATSTKFKVSINTDSITTTTNSEEYIWIFIPTSAQFTKIWFNNMDSTIDFNTSNVTYINDNNVGVEGIMYVSKNANLGTITLKFT